MDNLSRRGLLTGAGAVVAAGTFGVPAATARTLSLPTSKRFVMGGAGGEIFRSKPLQDVTVMQSFAFDTPNNRLFTGQVRAGSSANSGNLTLTQLSIDTGANLGHMYLTGFGHAVSIGAEAVGSTTYIWTETDVDTTNGRGRQITRFPWQNGATLTSTSVTKWKPVANGTVFTPAVDQRYGRLGVRYALSDGMHINVYSLAAARAGDFSTVLASFKQPALTTGVAFQGWALYGSYVYLWEGNAYPGSPNQDDATSKLWCYDINAGQLVDSFRTLAGWSLTYREAEGMAVYGSTDATARLYFGFASGVAGDRRANLFYRNELV
ncbi:teichoic acid biosynthesis protein C [Kribbella speibonae]|uniref:Teichoic acid biosynthesis protein C n=1 Tax=Kribbella speibonae TaxID=1572660 RepID=A0ABY1ZUC9_9ACTN|nr:teichoic acid biosynthesis protein C [Kribbella speibonae]TCC16245.1 teichoic acid biosynthesis protein C [Kribbella speibonae]